MSDRNWGNRFAAVGALAALLIVAWGWSATIYYMGAASARHDAEANGYAAQYPADTDKRIANCLSNGFGSDARQCVEDAITASHEAQRSEQDLNAQRDMSDWAWWLLVVSIAQIPIGIAGLAVLISTLRQGQDALERAREANAISGRVAAAELRPYLFVENVNLLDIEEDTEEIEADGEARTIKTFLWARVEVHLRNYGKVPARNIQVFRRSYYARFFRGRIYRFRKSLLPLPVCAPGYERRLFDSIYISKEDRSDFDEGVLTYVLRLRYTYENDMGDTFVEKADYQLNGDDLSTFYLLLGPHKIARARQRWAEIEPDLFEDVTADDGENTDSED